MPPERCIEKPFYLFVSIKERLFYSKSSWLQQWKLHDSLGLVFSV